MMLRRFTWYLLLTAVLSGQATAQTLVVDRGLQKSGPRSAGWTKNDKAFVADDFSIGKEGEVWMIDRLRTWAVVSSSNAPVGELFSNITLFGGLVDPANSDKPRPSEDCDCHGLVRAIKSVDLPQRPSSANADLKILEMTARGLTTNRLVQVDFENVRWSIPGGTDAQFGILAVTGANGQDRSAWLNYTLAGPADHLRIFNSSGHFQSMYSSKNGTPQRIAVQVWAHLSVEVSVRIRQSVIELVLKNSPALDVARVDRKSLRLEGIGSPMGSRIEQGSGPTQPETLVITLPGKPVYSTTQQTVCLTGKRIDGIPFEGCGLLPR